MAAVVTARPTAAERWRALPADRRKNFFAFLDLVSRQHFSSETCETPGCESLDIALAVLREAARPPRKKRSKAR